jgi:hypothetical protein
MVPRGPPDCDWNGEFSRGRFPEEEDSPPKKSFCCLGGILLLFVALLVGRGVEKRGRVIVWKKAIAVVTMEWRGEP